MSTGAPLNLTLEPSGFVGWTDAVNANFTGINAAIAALQAGGTTGATGPAGAAGAVGIIWAGPWSISTPYAATDAVSWNGSSYLALTSNTGVQPDTHPSTWAIIAMAGATGADGAAGPAGPTGPAGSSIALPIGISSGGTGATTAPGALVSLGAAARGDNSDIRSLSGISGMNIGSGELTINNGTDSCALTARSLQISEILPEPGGGALSLGSGAPGSAGVIIASGLQASGGVTVQSGLETDSLIVTGPTPTSVGPGQIGEGIDTAPTATAGGGQATPATVLGYRVWNNQGTMVKTPYYAV